MVVGFEGLEPSISVVVHTRATLGVPAKLSNEAVKCREYDALR
jgi:hypothetical protein